jgi:hypothetical protein
MRRADIKLVAHLDILGMTSLVERSFPSAWDMLSALVDVRDRAVRHEYEFVESNETVVVFEAIKSVIFSDTLVLFTPGASPAEVKSLLVLVTEIFHKALFNRVPVRAGIAMGEFRFDAVRSMYAGPALIEAYHVGESSQWLGISIAQSLKDFAVAQGMKSRASDVVIEWDVPVKGGSERRAVINWPALFAHDLKVAPPISLTQFYEIFRGSFGEFSCLPTSAQAKYLNTVHFMNHQLAFCGAPG